MAARTARGEADRAAAALWLMLGDPPVGSDEAPGHPSAAPPGSEHHAGARSNVEVAQVGVDERDRHGAFADRGGDALDGAVWAAPRHEHAGLAGFERQRRAVEPPPAVV